MAVVNFLAQVASSAKSSLSQGNGEGHAYNGDQVRNAISRFHTTASTGVVFFMQALRILNLFQEKFILRHVMKVPAHLRLNTGFEQAYSSLVKALVPVRGQTGGGPAVTKASPTAPTPKPSDKVRWGNNGVAIMR